MPSNCDAQSGPCPKAFLGLSLPDFCLSSCTQTCPDSVKVKASKSPWLKNLFLPNLTLFLDSRHFNQSEWNRLEHFAPPFGFMELNHSCESQPQGKFLGMH
jgi:hypothetical protein